MALSHDDRMQLVDEYRRLTDRLSAIAQEPQERHYSGGSKMPTEALDIFKERTAIAIALADAESETTFAGWR